MSDVSQSHHLKLSAHKSHVKRRRNFGGWWLWLYMLKISLQTLRFFCAFTLKKPNRRKYPVNSLFCPAHGCTNSRFIITELQNPRTREHVFLGSVWRAHWVQAPCAARAGCKICTRWVLIGSRSRWRGSCHSHKRRTSNPCLPLWPQIPVPVLSLSLFFFILSLVSPLLPVFSLVPSVVFRWTFV